MMKEEFEQRIGTTVTESDYRIIETVYTFHPAIDNVIGKDHIQNLRYARNTRYAPDRRTSARDRK